MSLCRRLSRLAVSSSRHLLRTSGRSSLNEGCVKWHAVCARSNSVLSPQKCSMSYGTRLLEGKAPHVCTKTCSCGMHKLTEADGELLNFLKEEIDSEKETIERPPKFKTFKVESEGSRVTLSKTQNGERVQVEFDLNENVNVDEPADSEEGEPMSKIVSYPSFYVQIIKDSGKTLQFQCEFNTGLDLEEEDGAIDIDDSDDLFRFENVAVLPRPDAKKCGISVYEAETENMDGNLYNMLTSLLHERGINNSFAQTLLEFSTNLEHRQYVDFLEDLRDFVKDK